MTLVKICGITSLEAARAALGVGADFLGFVFYRPSHRYVDPLRAGEIVATCRAEYGGAERWQAVGVFVDEPIADANAALATAGLDLAQVCGAESADYCRDLHRPVVRAVHVGRNGDIPRELRPAALGAARVLLDADVDGRYGGTGRTYSWDTVRHLAGDCFLAGGLTPANVGAAIRMAAPWAVDVSSGVETAGTKDGALIERFVREVGRVDRDGD
jgi:phosphoribosylanthranilate isomerase